MSLFAKAKKARENKKGFTLVELIVVLVILAILAAIMVPQLVGYIDRAKDKQYEVRCRNILIAAQTLLDEEYATVAKNTGGGTFNSASQIKDSKGADVALFPAIIALAEENSDVDIQSITTDTNSYKITGMEIDFTTSGVTATYTSSSDKKWAFTATE